MSPIRGDDASGDRRGESLASTGPIRDIVIVGGGTAGWMTAASLAHQFAADPVSITLIESDEIGTVGVGEATVPHIRFFNARLGIDEPEFMRRTQATFKLGIEFRDWGRLGDSYIHPFGRFGEDLDGVAFHHHWARLRQGGADAAPDDYSVAAVAARQDRFAHPAADLDSLFGSYSYAFQFDAGLYAGFLRNFAAQRGVVRREGRVVHADAGSGRVSSVTLASGEVIAGCLFIDCSGFRALLIDGAMKSVFEDWGRWLPCDRALAVPCDSDLPLSPYTRATAREAGWLWRIPLQHRVGNGHVYSSAHLDEDRAAAALLGQLEGAPRGDLRRLRFRAGVRRRQWAGNVVAIGLSAGFLEPLESTSIHLIQLAIGRLLGLFPDRRFDPALAAEFNRTMAIEYDRIRDFLVLHYHATERDDSPFWNDMRGLTIPDSLAERLEAFRRRGIVVNYRDGMFLDASWVAVLLGQRVLPAAIDPRAQRRPVADVASLIERFRQECAGAAAALPLQGDYLTRIGARAA